MLLVKCGRQCVIAECKLFLPNCELTEIHSSLVIPGSFLVTILTKARAMFLILGETFGRPIVNQHVQFDRRLFVGAGMQSTIRGLDMLQCPDTI